MFHITSKIVLAAFFGISSLGYLSETPADVVNLTATEDARVLSFFGDTNEGNGSLLSLFNNGSNNIQRSYIMFDLASLSGLTASGDAELTLGVSNQGAGPDLLNGELFLAAAGWNEATITWNNQPGSTGASLGSISGSFSNDIELTWTIPQAVIQGWINSPASNHGVLLTSDSGSTIGFDSIEGFVTDPGPHLSFTVVPEPASGWAIAVIGLGLCFRKRNDSPKKSRQ